MAEAVGKEAAEAQLPSTERAGQTERVRRGGLLVSPLPQTLAATRRAGRRRRSRFLATSLILPVLLPLRVSAACDLSQVVGYTLVQERTIEGYIENGLRQRGFNGCQPDRVLVFTDRTGLRCRSQGVQALDVPKAYIFARSQTDIKLCVGNDIYEMAPAN